MSNFHLDVLSITLAFGAAIFWLWASRIRFPDFDVGWGGSGGSADIWTGKLKTVSRLNSLAALCAAFAAIIQAIQLYWGL